MPASASTAREHTDQNYPLRPPTESGPSLKGFLGRLTIRLVLSSVVSLSTLLDYLVFKLKSEDMANLRNWWAKARNRLLDQREAPVSTDIGADQTAPKPDDFPVFPPLAPRDILQDPDHYWRKILARRYAAPQGLFQDSPLFALYRLYEFIVLDKVISYRNALEAFWRQRTWAVHDIPDPANTDAERYAFLACCAYLLARSFNQRVKLGLSRNMPALLTPEEAEEARNVPDNLRQYETVPDWAQKAPTLADVLVIPTEEGELLEGKYDARADPDFLAKNIVLWTPHIHFT